MKLVEVSAKQVHECIEVEYIGRKALRTGVRVPAGNGKAAPVWRDNLAEAQAVILTSAGHNNKSYAPIGDPAISFADVANILSDILGKEVPYITVSDQQYIENQVAVCLPEVAARFALGWVGGVNSGEWSEQTGDLERLLARKPTTAAESFVLTIPTHRSKSSTLLDATQTANEGGDCP